MKWELQPYLEYKDSGLPWLDKVPSHWEEKRAKFYFREADERSLTGEEELLSVSHVTGVTPRREKNITMFKAESYAGYKMCQPGDLVINTMWAWMAALGVTKHRGIVSSSYHVYRPLSSTNLISDYIDHLLRIRVYAAEYRVRSTGIRPSRLRLYPDKFLDIPIICPTLEEQESIIKFIKATNRKVSRSIRAKRRRIELLKEQRQVIINHAVTKGIDPNVKLKPSSVDYLGDIPEHWRIRRLRTIATVKPSGVDKNTVDGEIPISLCNYVDVYKNDYITSELSFMKATASQAEIDTFQLKAGDVIITKDSEDWTDIAVPAYVMSDLEDVICAYHLAMIRPKKELILAEYLFRAFGSEMIANQFRVSANGITRYGLSQNAIKSAFFPVPPIEEQEKAIEYINERCKEIDAAIIKANREIELIQEYRTRLISDVVTGKVDVRDIPVEVVEQVEQVEAFDEGDLMDEIGELNEVEEIVDADD